MGTGLITKKCEYCKKKIKKEDVYININIDLLQPDEYGLTVIMQDSLFNNFYHPKCYGIIKNSLSDFIDNKNAEIEEDAEEIIKSIINATTKEERLQFELFDIHDSYDVSESKAEYILNMIKNGK